MKKQLHIIFAVIAINSISVAQPIITSTGGTASHSQTFNISGSNFGTRSQDPESFFETWDWGFNEAPVDTLNSPWSTAGDDTDPARFSNEARRGGASDLNLRVIIPDRITGGSLNDIVERGGLNVTKGEKVYLSNFIWSTYAGADEFSSDCPQQWKIWNWLMHGRLSSDCSSIATGFSWTEEGINGPPNGDPHLWVRQSSWGLASHREKKAHWSKQPPVKTWWQVEIEYQVASDSGKADGYLRVWFDGTLKYNGAVGSWGGAQMDTCVKNHGYVYSHAILRNYIAWAGCPYKDIDTIRHDDVCYQLGTWARVLLGNAPTWASCTKREYQPIISWSGSGIGIKFNQGAFKNCDTAYLYVVDANGVNNNTGYPVIINCSGTEISENKMIIEKIFLSPNPTNGSFTMSFSQQIQQDVTIKITDLLGRVIYTEKINKLHGNYSKTFDFSLLGEGMYTISVLNSAGVVNEKIIIR